jgi:YegS/Rv2252/BmrU family lipid kinase
LRRSLGDFDVERTRGPRDAERIAREAVGAGVERIIVAGGDGTLSEVATGLLASDLADRVAIGLLPLGTGGDFVRTVGVSRDPERAVAALASHAPRAIDAGRVTYLDRGGKSATSYFVNVASFGMGGLVDEMVNRTTKALGGTASFLLGTLRALVRFRGEPVGIRLDGEPIFEGLLAIAAAANGRYFGGGMHVAPRARLDDGLLDVIVVPNLPRLRLLSQLPLLYRGTHVEAGAATAFRGRVLEATAEPGSVLIDVDGEPLGSLPLRIEILPGALSLLVPAA